jgi:hypothetical protein
MGEQLTQDSAGILKVIGGSASLNHRPDGAGSIYPAGGDAGSAEAVGPAVSDHSYGFRPGRSAHQAVAQAQQYIAEGHGWCVDLD